jgi:hypothetical protein
MILSLGKTGAQFGAKKARVNHGGRATTEIAGDFRMIGFEPVQQLRCGSVAGALCASSFVSRSNWVSIAPANSSRSAGPARNKRGRGAGAVFGRWAASICSSLIWSDAAGAWRDHPE